MRSTQQGPVTRVEDPTIPAGYRELCTPAELRRRKAVITRAHNGICAICHEPMLDYRDVELDHEEPKGMGGGRRDDSMENLRATHRECNRAKGSIRGYQPKESEVTR
jgi:5-methylcytosine-specific restriction endonuclease McrA